MREVPRQRITARRRSQRGDSRGGGFLLLPHCVLASEAFRTASPRAVKMLLAICARHTGFNNGAIAAGLRDLGEWMDCQNHTANSGAIGELVNRGLVVVECEHPKARRLSTEYRLTFMETDSGPATNDYLHWRRGDAGTVSKRSVGNFGVATTATRLAVPVAITATGDETSRCGYGNGRHAKLPFPQGRPVAIAATHIGKPYEGGSRPALKRPPQTGGPLSSAPDAEELRRRVLAVLSSAQRGSQRQLAALAAIRPAALSKFLHESGTLNEEARIRLTIALPRIGVADAVTA